MKKIKNNNNKRRRLELKIEEIYKDILNRGFSLAKETLNNNSRRYEISKRRYLEKLKELELIINNINTLLTKNEEYRNDLTIIPAEISKAKSISNEISGNSLKNNI